jgi:uncharacterized DUF497 family protein
MCSDQAVQVRGIEPVKVCGIRHDKEQLEVIRIISARKEYEEELQSQRT